MRTTWTRWLFALSDDELNALVASMPPPSEEMDAEMKAWTPEQLEAAARGAPLEVVRAMGAQKAVG